jgi:hypothetical protein
LAHDKLTNELNEIYLPVNARGTNTEILRWPNLFAQQGIPWSLLQAIQATSQDIKQSTTRAKRAAAATMWISGVPMEQIEVQLNQHLYNRGGLAGVVRTVADCTRDLLPALAAVVRSLDPYQPVDDLVERTMLRLELGLPADLVELADTVTTQLTRTQWLQLRTAGLVTIAAVEKAAPAELGKVLGSDKTATTLHQELRDRPRATTSPRSTCPGLPNRQRSSPGLSALVPGQDLARWSTR